MFKDRKDAGKKLAEKLLEYEGDKNAIVVALPRGGVVIGYYLAKRLHLPLDIVCPRKLASPMNPEYALGVVTEAGDIISNYSEDLTSIAEREIQVAKERLKSYREGLPPRDFANKRVILTDDGIATGSTLVGAICTLKEAKEIILAVPVAPKESLEKLRPLVSRVICLEIPELFYAVGQFYKEFEQTSDAEVKTLLREAQR